MLFLNFGLLCNLDTPLDSLEIGKYLTWEAVFFENIGTPLGLHPCGVCLLK